MPVQMAVGNLRDLSVQRGEAERKSFSQRSDAQKWAAAWKEHVREGDRWETELVQLFAKLDGKLDYAGAVRSANDAWEREYRTVVKTSLPDKVRPSGGWGMLLSRMLSAGSRALSGVRRALQRRADEKVFVQDGAAIYMNLAAATGQKAGEMTLEALGLNKTFSWTGYRDFAPDKLKVRGSKIIQHAYGAHLDQLTRLVVRKCDPRHPLTIQELTKQIREEWPALSKAHAARIARTESAAVWEQMQLNSMMANGVEKVEWLIAHGPQIGKKVGPVCPACLKMSVGGPYNLTGPNALKITPPRHPNCFVGSTLVGGPAPIGATSRAYTGDIVTITLADGNIVSVTPNHPILTLSGWKLAGCIEEGDYTISTLNSEGASLSDKYGNDRPTAISNVFDSFGLETLTTVQPTPIDFHGEGGTSEINIVRTDCFLRSKHGSTLHQPPRQLSSRSGLRLDCSSFAGSSTLAESIKRVFTSSNSIVCLRDLIYTSDITHSSPLSSLSFTRGPHHNTVLFEPANNSRTADSVLARKLIGGHSGKVLPNKVVRIRRVPFTGHVYNLETVEGWYSANGIIAHNCRCTTVPVLSPTWLPPAKPLVGAINLPPAGAELPSDSELLALTKSLGWTAPTGGWKAPQMSGGALALHHALTAAQLAERAAAGRARRHA